MTSIYLIRHAEAEGNLYRRAQGQYDANVTQMGRKQIAALAERFRDVPVDELWSSDLNRAVSTASAITKYHPQLRLHTSPALRELCMGVWEDVPWGVLERDWPEQMTLFATDTARWSVPGGEDFSQVPVRLERSLLGLAATHPGRTIAVVSHGLAMRALFCRILGIPSEKIASMPYGDNTAVSLLTADEGKLSLEFYNDASHLPEELSTFAHQSWWRAKGVGKEDTILAPMDPRKEGDEYSRCYAQTWRASHGNLNGYAPSLYLHLAIQHVKTDPACLTRLTVKGKPAGLIELDPLRGVEEEAGWISLLYVEPEYRGMRLGAQLIGHAVSHFRRQGRKRLRLHVSQTNTAAIGFYDAIGFQQIGVTDGVGGALYLMDMDITQRPWTLP
ncbi:MAG: bifunctional histidine phosphatase family protein/GNAT family N-acetyltransferase [Oscillospiraceae bacterium]|nr:bifunctional histidine phosphatase family protein/GNAT family N-acetyltransferase [Oscillospiraceae bacterium]MCD8116974.1 bifunctional histidine phosphatase family protein/GNAT family N-acetyltransferase [Oscillospiraceae bacterium]